MQRLSKWEFAMVLSPNSKTLILIWLISVALYLCWYYLGYNAVICKTYQYSCKNRRELEVFAGELGVDVRIPTRIKGTWWVPHVLRALSCMLTPPKKDDHSQFSVVFAHMEHFAATHPAADIKGRAKKIVSQMSTVKLLASTMPCWMYVISWLHSVFHCKRTWQHSLLLVQDSIVVLLLLSPWLTF